MPKRFPLSSNRKPGEDPTCSRMILHSFTCTACTAANKRTSLNSFSASFVCFCDPYGSPLHWIADSHGVSTSRKLRGWVEMDLQKVNLGRFFVWGMFWLRFKGRFGKGFRKESYGSNLQDGVPLQSRANSPNRCSTAAELDGCVVP